jgi:hypothetical protein
VPGTHHGHPDPEAIAQLIKHAPAGDKIIYFNYRNGRTDPWSDPALCHSHGYRTAYPTDPIGILPIDI